MTPVAKGRGKGKGRASKKTKVNRAPTPELDAYDPVRAIAQVTD